MCKIIKDRIIKFISEIESFDFSVLYDIKKGSTQKSSDITEKYVNEKLEECFSNEYIIFRGSSQTYPDFILVSKKIFKNSIDDNIKEKINKKNKNGISCTGLLIKWAAETNNNDKLIYVESKSTKGAVYQCNDTLPSPRDSHIYVMFDVKNKTSLVTTSMRMARNFMETNPETIDLFKKYDEEKEQIKSWRNDKKDEWKKVGIGSTPRMTYTIDRTYAHAEYDIMELVKLFEEAK